jgi:hypothetical protein
MPLASESALKARARSLMVAMTERSRWIYALPRDGSFARARAIAEEHGMAVRETADEGRVLKLEPANDGGARLLLFDNRRLDVVLLEGAGDTVAPVVRAIVETAGFLPQSRLWGAALDIGEPGCERALAILGHMAVSWDDDWTDLFLLHLASPDATVRRQAIDALTVAALVAADTTPALELLGEARRRERFPKLAETLDEAIRALQGVGGGPAELA